MWKWYYIWLKLIHTQTSSRTLTVRCHLSSIRRYNYHSVPKKNSMNFCQAFCVKITSPHHIRCLSYGKHSILFSRPLYEIAREIEKHTHTKNPSHTVCHKNWQKVSTSHFFQSVTLPYIVYNPCNSCMFYSVTKCRSFIIRANSMW